MDKTLYGNWVEVEGDSTGGLPKAHLRRRHGLWQLRYIGDLSCMGAPPVSSPTKVVDIEASSAKLTERWPKMGEASMEQASTPASPVGANWFFITSADFRVIR